MNIFVLDNDPKLAAQYHCSKHVVKMILEHVQILSTAHHVLGSGGPLKKTHVNHPCTIWARQSSGNYDWLHDLTIELCKEYTFRYNKYHKYDREGTLMSLKKPPFLLPRGPMTPFAQAMPDQYKDKDAVVAYRNYYIGDKKGMLHYKNREAPEWIPIELLQQHEEIYDY